MKKFSKIAFHNQNNMTEKQKSLSNEGWQQGHIEHRNSQGRHGMGTSEQPTSRHSSCPKTLLHSWGARLQRMLQSVNSATPTVLSSPCLLVSILILTCVSPFWDYEVSQRWGWHGYTPLPGVCGWQDNTEQYQLLQETTLRGVGPAPTQKHQCESRSSTQDPSPGIGSPMGNQVCIGPRLLWDLLFGKPPPPWVEAANVYCISLKQLPKIYAKPSTDQGNWFNHFSLYICKHPSSLM